MGIKQLSGDLSNALANVPKVFSFDLSNTVCYAGDKSETIGDQESKGLGTKLPVLLVIVELSELTGDSVKVREIAVAMGDYLEQSILTHRRELAVVGASEQQ